MAYGPLLRVWMATPLPSSRATGARAVPPAPRGRPSRAALFVAALAGVAVLTLACSAVAVGRPTPSHRASRVTARADTDTSPWALAVIAGGIGVGVVLAMLADPCPSTPRSARSIGRRLGAPPDRRS